MTGNIEVPSRPPSGEGLEVQEPTKGAKEATPLSSATAEGSAAARSQGLVGKTPQKWVFVPFKPTEGGRAEQPRTFFEASASVLTAVKDSGQKNKETIQTKRGLPLVSGARQTANLNKLRPYLAMMKTINEDIAKIGGEEDYSGFQEGSWLRGEIMKFLNNVKDLQRKCEKTCKQLAKKSVVSDEDVIELRKQVSELAKMIEGDGSHVVDKKAFIEQLKNDAQGIR